MCASSSATMNGQALGYFCFEDEPGRQISMKRALARRGPADGGELRQAAGAAEAGTRR